MPRRRRRRFRAAWSVAKRDGRRSRVLRPARSYTSVSMDIKLPSDMIAVVKAERERRAALLDTVDPEYAYDYWVFTVEPFINELCLVLLVAIRHEVERELLSLVARTSNDGKPISRRAYLDRLQDERGQLMAHGWKSLIKRLNLTSFPEWASSMKTLQLLANCYKHDPIRGPDEALLVHLKLDQTVKYDLLPDSRCFREGLALSLGLDKDADYCDIAEFLLAEANRFLTKVAKQPCVVTVKRGRVSLRSSDAVC